MEIQVKGRRDTLLGFTCMFLFYFGMIRWSATQKVTRSGRMREQRLGIAFVQVWGNLQAWPLDTERACAIDLPILVHLQAWRQGFGVLAMGWWNLENLIMDESSRREYEWTCLDLYMLDATWKQYLVKLSLREWILFLRLFCHSRLHLIQVSNCNTCSSFLP